MPNDIFEKIKAQKEKFSVAKEDSKVKEPENPVLPEAPPVSVQNAEITEQVNVNSENQAQQPESQLETPPVNAQDSVKSEEANLQKRVHDTQAKLTEVAQERARYKKLLMKYPTLLKYDDEGNPLEWDESLEKKTGDEDNIVQIPTSEEFFDKTDESLKKIIKITKEETIKEIEAKRALEEKQNKKVALEKAMITAREESFKRAAGKYPDIAVENSEFRMKCEQVFANNPFYRGLPNADEIVALVVAEEMGVLPKTVASKKVESSKPVVKQSNLMGLGNTIKTGENKAQGNALPSHVTNYFENAKRFQTV